MTANEPTADEMIARIVAAAPPLTPEQAAVITRHARRNTQARPAKAEAAPSVGATRPPRRVA